MLVKVQCTNPDCRESFSISSAEFGADIRCRRCGRKIPGLSTVLPGQSAASDSEPSNPKFSPDSEPSGPKFSPDSGLQGQFGRYEIIRPLGSGGMGQVYLARDKWLERPVALKVPHVHLTGDPKLRQRFYREAQAAARLHHPNICPIFDIDEVGPILYLAMAYLEGPLLTTLIDEDNPPAPDRACRIVRTLAEALQEAHDKGVIHRDLKPSNIILVPQDRPVVMDFGLARLVSDQAVPLTQIGGLVGTPSYMSPEQVEGDVDAIGPATDIYSLGVILYELLTGRLPFRGPLMSVLKQIQETEPPRLSMLRPGLPPRLEDVCLRAMAKRREDRYATMAEMAEALAAVTVGSLSASATPPLGGGQSDRPDETVLIREAVQDKRSWQVIYHAKRLMQMDPDDQDAYNALVSLDARYLTYYDEGRRDVALNPFLRFMDVDTLNDFVRESELVERKDGEVICRHNDRSRTMFLILRGEVGIYLPRVGAGGIEASGAPDHRMGTGHIVGELAFALKRKRTATVRALKPTSLMAFSYESIRDLIGGGTPNPSFTFSVDNYLKSRVLKYIFDTAPYLSGRDGCEHPLAGIAEPWHLIVRHATILTVDHQKNSTLSYADEMFCGKGGIFLLASGELRGEYLAQKVLDEKDLPIIFARFDNQFVNMHARYKFDRPITIVHIDQAAFIKLNRIQPGVLGRVVERIKRAMTDQFRYDVFLSYTQKDREVVGQWKQALEEAGLRVYLDAQQAPAKFIPLIQAAILDSLVLMPILTENTSARGRRDNWVRREIEFREKAFDREVDHIFPINLGGGQNARYAPGHIPIHAFGRETVAIGEVIEIIRKLKGGEGPIPYSTLLEIPTL
jgi:serine/threonine protein kinase